MPVKGSVSGAPVTVGGVVRISTVVIPVELGIFRKGDGVALVW